MNSEVDPRLASALDAASHVACVAGRRGQRVGWKLGMGDRERIGAGPVIGHLTTATLLTARATFRAAGIAAPHAHVGVVATHVFHRAVAFAPVTCAQMATDVSGQLVVGGTVRD